MPLEFNGNSPQSITFNGNQVDYVYYNGDLVWQSWLPLTYTYTGTCTESTITSGGNSYKLLTLTSDGTLTFNRNATVDIWCCGGGSNGIGAPSSNSGAGGAGAYCNESDNISIKTIGVVIGPANTASGTIITGDTSLTAAGVANSKNGGTGGGGDSSGSSTRGTGDGKSKYPFLDSTNFSPHCAGGGGGSYNYHGSTYYKGGSGGTNGGNGTNRSSQSSSSLISGGSGGNYGGGTGGKGEASSSLAIRGNGYNATFYGSGGGGGGWSRAGYDPPSGTYPTSRGSGGSGYQGVCYIKIPIEEF